MRTLAIETSCDDTSIAIVEVDDTDGRATVPLLSSLSQLATHQPYGGVVPELASRQHSHDIIDLIGSLDIDRGSIDLISTTTTPGLPGSLVVGKTAGRTLSALHNIPYQPTNHIHGHIVSYLLDRPLTDMKFSTLVLSVSGGHNDLYLIKKTTTKSTLATLMITRLAHTRDDAAGEAFDKVARMLGGPYPGGKRIQDHAEHGTHDPQRSCPRAYMTDMTYSFSGIKGHLHHKLSTYKKKNNLTTLDDALTDTIAYEFQEAVCDMLIRPVMTAAQEHDVQTIALVGGVSANTRLRHRLQHACHSLHNGQITLTRPAQFAYCTDNAAMIGLAGIMTHREQLVVKQ